MNGMACVGGFAEDRKRGVVSSRKRYGNVQEVDGVKDKLPVMNKTVPQLYGQTKPHEPDMSIRSVVAFYSEHSPG